MTDTRKIGFILPQRGAFFGLFSIPELVDITAEVDSSGAFDSVWVGDSLLSVPRPESLTLLGALAASTSRVQLAVGCMASLPIRDPILLAAQWATVDQLSRGRTLMAACLGIVKADGGASDREGAPYGIPDRARAPRMEENIRILRRLWTEDAVTFEGQHTRFTDITVHPKPVQSPPPIYIAAQPNPDVRSEKVLRRIAAVADGWMSTRKNPRSISKNLEYLAEYLREEGRDLASFPVTAYHNVNLNPDREEAYAESKRFLDEYYGPIFSVEDTRHWTAAGTVNQAVADIQQLFAEGATEVALRVNSWNWRDQLKVLVDEVIPAVRAGEAGAS